VYLVPVSGEYFTISHDLFAVDPDASYIGRRPGEDDTATKS
jgi:hypothetical protein